jgi:phosphate-selective porin OprO/OprP
MIKSRFNRLAPACSVAALAAVLATVSAPASANMEALLEKLHAKGVLSDEEYKEMRQEAREAARANRDFKADIMGDKAKRELPTGLNGAFGNNFTWTSGDGANSIRLTGRVHTDYRFADNDMSLAPVASNDRDTASIADGFELRRTRLGVSGTLFRDVDYNAVLNMVGSAPVVDTAFMNFKYLPNMNFQFGRFKQPFSLGQLTSSNDIDFAERSYVDQVIPGKKLGAMVHGEPKPGFTYAASVFQEGENEINQTDGSGKRYAGRLTANFAQFAEIPNTVLHFGVAGVGGEYEVRPSTSSQTTSLNQSTTRATIVGFRTMNRGLANVYRAQIAGLPSTQTGANQVSEFGVNVDQTLAGLEFALARNTLKFQGEWVRANYAAANLIGANQRVKGDVDTYYLQAVWNITGEKWSDMYRSGVFRGVTPNNNFKLGSGWGAWQVGLRWSQYDATDVRVSGAGAREQSGTNPQVGITDSSDMNDRVNSYGIGVNWILNPMTRMMFEWTRTDFGGLTLPLDVSGTGSTGVKSEDIFSFRAQVMF